MKRFSEQFKKSANSYRLSALEKRELRERVVSYMEYHPVPASEKKEYLYNSEEGQSFKTFKIIPANPWKFIRWSGSFAIILVFSISLLAERAVPGDALYAIKVSVNEEFRSTLNRNSYEKVVWETELLNRRISEARLLADEGRLTPEMEVQVADAVRTHSENAKKEIENIKLTDKDEATLASLELATALDVQNTSLKNRGQSGSEGKSTNLIENVLTESKATDTFVEEDSLPAYDRLMAKVEVETTRAQELLQGVNKSATAEEQIDIQRRLDDIDRKISTAMEVSATNELEARQGVVLALQQTQRLIVFMTNIDVRSSLTVNDIVPVTLTTEERLALLTTQVSKTEEILLLVENVLNYTSSTTTVDSELAAKAMFGFNNSKKMIVEINEVLSGTMEDINMDSIEVKSNEAHNLAVDVSQLLEVTLNEKIDNPEIEVMEDVVTDIEDTATTTNSTSTASTTIEQ